MRRPVGAAQSDARQRVMLWSRPFCSEVDLNFICRNIFFFFFLDPLHHSFLLLHPHKFGRLFLFQNILPYLWIKKHVFCATCAVGGAVIRFTHLSGFSLISFACLQLCPLYLFPPPKSKDRKRVKGKHGFARSQEDSPRDK